MIDDTSNFVKDFVSFLKIKAIPRKFKGGICPSSHFVVTRGGQLLYLQIFSLLDSVNDSFLQTLPFVHELSDAHILYDRTENAPQW